MHQLVIASLIILLGSIASYIFKKLTLAGSFMGCIIAFVIYFGVGWLGLLLLGGFFAFGSLVTAWKKDEKQQSGLQEVEETQRKAGQVLANAGAPALFCLAAIIDPGTTTTINLMLAASFSAALSDTFSSELGSIYGKQFVNVLSFKKDTRGRDGVISLEGTAAGFVGAAIIAVLYSAVTAQENFLPVFVAGITGNFIDSILGALFERKGQLTNDLTNFLSCLIAGLSILVLF